VVLFTLSFEGPPLSHCQPKRKPLCMHYCLYPTHVAAADFRERFWIQPERHFEALTCTSAVVEENLGAAYAGFAYAGLESPSQQPSTQAPPNS